MEQSERGAPFAEDRWNPAGRGARPQVVLTADRCEVHVPTPDDGEVIVDVRQRRPEVVARLLDLGVSARTLTILLPGWTSLIEEVAATRH